MTEQDPLTALHHWYAADREQQLRMFDHDPGTDQAYLEVAMVLHRRHSGGAETMLRLAAGVVVDPPEEHRPAIEDWVGKPLLESLRRAVGRVDQVELARVRGVMDATADAQEATGVADYAVLSRQSRELEAVTGNLRAVVADIYMHLEEKAAQNQLSAIEEAARQVPGTNLRITETVAGPDGTQHVVRDVLATGPDQDLAHVDVNYSTPAARRQLLGLDDARAAELAGQHVQQLRAVRALRLLGLPDTATANQVQDKAIARFIDRGRLDGEIGGVVGDVPDGMVGLMPGHFTTLRASALLLVVDAVQDAANRGRRGDMVAAGGGTHLLLVGLALTHGTVFHLPAARVPATGPRTERPGTLPAGDVVVFHDRPLALEPGTEAIGWIFTTADDGTVADFAQVILAAGNAENVGLELTNVNLARGAAAVVAARVLAGIAEADWQEPRKRKLPGRPGDKAWRDALGRAAAAELQTGWLGAVHTPDRNG